MIRGTTDSKDSQTYPTQLRSASATYASLGMTRATYFTAHSGDLEFTLCHRTPHWELTVHNNATRTLWIQGRTPVPAGGTYTISRYTRVPAYRLSVAYDANVWHYEPTAINLTVDAVRVSVTKGLAVTHADFNEVPTRSWHFTSHALPLSVSVYGSARGTNTAVQYRNTSTTDTLTLGCRALPPGETRTVTGKAWTPWSHLHDIYATSAAGKRYYCVVNVGLGRVYLHTHEWDSAPAPAPVIPDPHFDALQQLSLRNPTLLTDILRSQGFTPGQILAFQNAVAEL